FKAAADPRRPKPGQPRPKPPAGRYTDKDRIKQKRHLNESLDALKKIGEDTNVNAFARTMALSKRAEIAARLEVARMPKQITGPDGGPIVSQTGLTINVVHTEEKRK